MHYWEKVITVLVATWPLTTAPVIVVKSGATHVNAWWRCMVEDESPTTVCDTCNAPCHSNKCMEAHKTKHGRQSSSMCDTMLFCPDCCVKLHNYKKKGLNKHTCGKCYCFNCKFTYHPEEDRHLCYMHSINATKCQQRTLHQFIFYDFESMLLHSGTHRPNLVVAQSICERCSVHVPTCSTCGS